MILPGSTLGMLGGGQLGRMFTIAARTMGYHVIVLDPSPDSPAGRMADQHLRAAYTDEWALKQMARACDAMTVEFESIPAEVLRRLERSVAVRPSSLALETTQNRIREKTFIRDTGLATADFRAVRSLEELQTAWSELSPPLILKRATFGYDGKGQAGVQEYDGLRATFEGLDQVPCVLEQRVDLNLELSIVLARSLNGHTCCFPPAENVHTGGILSTSIVPARVDAKLAQEARDMATRLAEALDYCGVMAVEFFITHDDQLLVNEIAPRPHNSGHYTIDACITSQFEQQVRMMCGLPAGNPKLQSPVVMVNLLGDLWEKETPDWSRVFRYPTAKLHLYGKREARPGRKMGHVCCLHENLDTALEMARDVLGEIDPL